MEQIIILVLVWAFIFIVIPFERIKLLFLAAIIGFVWMTFIDNIAANLGYYKYLNSPFIIGRAPVFQNLIEAGLGILMINWLTEKSYTKLIAVFTAAFGFVGLHAFYVQRGLFSFGTFDQLLNFIFHIAALSIFTWVSLGIIGERKVYSGQRLNTKLTSSSERWILIRNNKILN